jgi:hypothetical protein
MKCGHYFAGILVNKHGMSWLLNPAFANIVYLEYYNVVV